MKTNKIIITITVAIVLALLGAGAYILIGGGSQSTAQTDSSQSNEAELGRVTTGDITKTVSSEGTVKASETNPVKTQAAGTVSEIYAGVGAQVQQGDPLYALDTDELARQYEQAKANLTDKMMQAGNTEPSYDEIVVRAPVAGEVKQSAVKYNQDVGEALQTADALLVITDEDGNDVAVDAPGEGTVSQVKSGARVGKTVKAGAELFTVKVPSKAFANSVQEVREAREAVERLEAYMKDPVVYAETGGIVDAVYADVIGTVTQKGTTVMSIQSRSGYELHIKVSQSELESLSLGQEAEVKFGSGEAYGGYVKHINYIADDNGNFQISIALREEDARLADIYPGITGKVSITLEKREDVLRVPVGALKEDSGGEYVMVYTGTPGGLAQYNTASIPMEKRYIERGMTNSLYAEVISGLQKGEEVVIVNTSNSNSFFDMLNSGSGTVQFIGQ